MTGPTGRGSIVLVSGVDAGGAPTITPSGRPVGSGRIILVPSGAGPDEALAGSGHPLGRGRVILIPRGTPGTPLHRQVWGYAAGNLWGTLGVPFPFGPLIEASSTGHLGADVDASSTMMTLADFPGFADIVLDATEFNQNPILWDLAGESVLYTDEADLTAIVEREPTGGVPHLSGEAIVQGDHHGTGSIVSGVVTLTVPTMGTFAIAYGGKIDDGGAGITGTWGFELHRNGVPIDHVDAVPQGAEVVLVRFHNELAGVSLNAGDRLTVWCVSGGAPENIAHIDYVAIRIYGVVG